jgi:hypothetical protein
VNNPEEVREWASSLLDGDLAKYLTDAVLESSPPAWGDATGWEDHIARSDLWLLAHARWRLDQQAIAGVQVWLHGRGVRVHSSERSLDVFCVDIYEFDRVLHQEVTK